MVNLEAESQTRDIEINLLLEALFLKYGADFRNYSRASIRRRLDAALVSLGYGAVGHLQSAVLEDSTVYIRLLQFLTVPTSEMFRDPSYFKALREEVLPILATYPSIKVWVAGCSTGEELYSMAILLREEGLLDRTILYATDINPVSLQKAEDGIFPLTQVASYTANYQRAGGKAAFSDYYRTDHRSAIFDASLKKGAVFADHSLATDSVFAEVQLISCRNVLIYFNRELQDRVFKLFYDSLDRRGFLGIGSKETARFSEVAARFEEFRPKDRIYRRKAGM